MRQETERETKIYEMCIRTNDAKAQKIDINFLHPRECSRFVAVEQFVHEANDDLCNCHSSMHFRPYTIERHSTSLSPIVHLFALVPFHNYDNACAHLLVRRQLRCV